MKLAKLSLAAIVAAGAMTTFASAAPLEEAIKGVQVSGMMRYRWATNNKSKYNASTAYAGSSDQYRWSVPITFVMPVAENLTAGVGFNFDSYTHGKTDMANQGSWGSPKHWITYATPEYSLRVGRFEISSPWTETGYAGSRGQGFLGTLNMVENWTFAAAYFASLAGMDNNVWNIGWAKQYGTQTTGPVDGSNDLYAFAAIGSVGPVNLQAWYSKMQDVFKSSVFVQADVAYEGFSLKAQANQLKLDGVAKEGYYADGTGDFSKDKGTFWGAEAGFGMNGFSIGAGITQNDKKMPIYSLDDDNDGMIKAGWQMYYHTTNAFAARNIFVKAGYAWDQYRVNVGFVNAQAYNAADKQGDKVKARETYIDAGYKYSKNFDLSVHYSIFDSRQSDDVGFTSRELDPTKVKGVYDRDNSEFKFQALYSF
ncbi:MAG: major outer membrane protein [Sulfurospirillaceae bacterium]|nr:major outer membrane protein [Sulfurospirillaceae bacterium]